MTTVKIPKDEYWLSYFIFFWIGIVCLVPKFLLMAGMKYFVLKNRFIDKISFSKIVNGYWMYKFRNVTLDDFEEYSNESGDNIKTNLQLYWQSYLSIALCVPNVFFFKLNAIFGHRFPPRPRILGALVLNILLFVFLIVMTKINTDNWQFTFMVVTLIMVTLFSIVEALLGGAVYGLVGKFPPPYIGIFMSILGAGCEQFMTNDEAIMNCA